MTTDDISTIMQMIEDCEARESRLSELDRGFIDSLSNQIKSGRHPSQKQVDMLNSIWDRATARG